MPRTLTMRLSDAQAERLERFARDRNTDLEQDAAQARRHAPSVDIVSLHA